MVLAPGAAVEHCAAGNDRAVTFYQRHGLDVAEIADGLRYYHERMGVTFPEGTAPFGLVLMRR